MRNLKHILMELGNRLVMDYRYNPATIPDITVGTVKLAKIPNTIPIKEFTEFLNNSPEARQVLLQLGLEWPVVKDRSCTKEVITLCKHFVDDRLFVRREAIIEKLFSQHDFSPDIVKDFDDWEYYATNAYKRVFYLDVDNKNSTRHEFRVVFVPNTTQVAEMNWE